MDYLSNSHIYIQGKAVLLDYSQETASYIANEVKHVSLDSEDCLCRVICTVTMFLNLAPEHTCKILNVLQLLLHHTYLIFCSQGCRG